MKSINLRNLVILDMNYGTSVNPVTQVKRNSSQILV